MERREASVTKRGKQKENEIFTNMMWERKNDGKGQNDKRLIFVWMLAQI